MEGDCAGNDDSVKFLNISIHSLRMEGDSRVFCCKSRTGNFNPLPPHGGRPFFLGISTYAVRFQSTPSAWRETSRIEKVTTKIIFQSTPSAWRETTVPFTTFVSGTFQSTPSAWRETDRHEKRWFHVGISIHSLRMEGDPLSSVSARISKVFQSTPSAWRETFPPLNIRPM